MSGCEPCGCDPDYVGEQGYDQGKSGWVCARHQEEQNWQRAVDQVVFSGPTISVTSGGGLGTSKIIPPGTKPIRQFDSGATRNVDTAKFDFEGFLNPEALHAFGEYMHEHRLQRDGTVRDADNWQKGIPLKVYIKSLVRHTIDLWRMDRGYEVINPDTGLPQTKKALCAAITFNAMGYLKELVDPAPINRVAK